MALTPADLGVPSGLFPDLALLTGQLAPSSLAGYRRDVVLYRRFCADPATALHATSLARWRTHLAEDTRLSPYTINRRLAAVKRLLQEAAVQGYVDLAAAEAFRRVAGVQTKALKDRIKTTARTRITTGRCASSARRPTVRPGSAGVTARCCTRWRVAAVVSPKWSR